MALRPAHDGVDAGNQLVLVERLGHVVVGTKAEAFDLVVDLREARQDQDRRLHLAHAQGLENVISAHVRQVDVKKNNVVIIELAEIDPLLAKIGRVNIETFGLKHQLDALRRCAIVLDKKDPHANPHFPGPTFGPAAPVL